MLELRLIGVHDDGENLVLESADGTRFLLPIDANLRTSITKARRIQPARGLGAKAPTVRAIFRPVSVRVPPLRKSLKSPVGSRSACAATSGRSLLSVPTLFVPLRA